MSGISSLVAIMFTGKATPLGVSLPQPGVDNSIQFPAKSSQAAPLARAGDLPELLWREADGRVVLPDEVRIHELDVHLEPLGRVHALEG